ncbi:nucleotidyltransferase domain-containing protein [Halovenus salina]|uniref:Nucleotidyltransferase domain-containing protein n=1 Tax=Halovenus salina TaxID=1510225 RepID=A0ABD5W071_9EURY|nr:nucleotidyltransferase domain-containing protein [Halovenus salina]
MRTQSSDNAGETQSEASVGLPIPIRDASLFKHSASAPVVNFLADNPEFDLSVRQLARVTDVSARATADAVDALAANGIVEVVHEGNARRVRLNRARFDNPGDPVERIPQVQYRTPVRIACQYLTDELQEVLGIVLFGSVARGEADRQSDIDLWVLVADDLLEQRNAANTLARKLEELQIPPSVALLEAQDRDFDSQWPAMRQRLEADDREWASAQRHSFEFVVETPQSIRQQSTRVNTRRLFGEGITIRSSDGLDSVKREVLRDE